MEDEDEFVDAVDGTEDKQSSSPEINQSNDAEDGFGDDDFGDFGDFAAEGDDEDEDEGHEEYNPEAEDEARRSEEIKRQDAIAKEELKADTPNLPPLPDFTGKSKDQIFHEVLDYLRQGNQRPPPEPLDIDSSNPPEPLNNERAMSLWNQLAAPVPLNPPDWKRSRIRRLFLVSLGIPVNLDEILPASGKKKKLVLPSTKPETPTPTLSGKLPPSAPPFDAVSARHQASVSMLALKNMTDGELLTHIDTLKRVNSQASENLTYWLARREEAVSEKESLEGVIESLVGWTERQRKGTTGIAMVPGQRGKTPPPQSVKKGRKK